MFGPLSLRGRFHMFGPLSHWERARVRAFRRRQLIGGNMPNGSIFPNDDRTIRPPGFLGDAVGRFLHRFFGKLE